LNAAALTEKAYSAMESEGDAERLLIEAAKTDPARFAELYDNNFGRVYAYILRRVGVRHVAEDLTSEVFLRALAGLRRFEWRGLPFAAWLFRIAANEISDLGKRMARDRLGVQPAESTDAGIEEVERRARLFALVEGLPADQSRVILMRFAEEKTVREIADELGRTEGAVKQLQFRALRNLRAALGPDLRTSTGEDNG
jgi:RNA polymerase sigma-70 factor, ECF subfamily